MQLTTKGRYAVTALLDLALHDQGEPVVLAQIAQRQHLSLAYLEQLFARLRRQGLVSSTRGPGGGYTLARPSEQISLVDVMRAVDEPLDATRCQGGVGCHHHGRCLTHELWAELNDHVSRFLSGISLADLVRQYGPAPAGGESPDAGLPPSLGLH